MPTPPRTCLILGSGMGGLALGALLARAGTRVTVLESHPAFVGGYAHTLALDGYRFAAGPRYLWNFGPGQIGHRFLAKCDLLARVPLVELDRTGFDHVYLADADPVRVPNGWDAYGALLKERFPHEARGIDRFFALCRRAFRPLAVIDELGLHLAPWAAVLPRCFWRAPGATAWALANRALTLGQVFDRCGLSRPLRAVLYAHGGIFALTAAEVSFHVYVGGTLFYHRGCYYPANDMAGFVGALVATIEQHGGHLLRGRQVVSAEADRNGVRRVVTADGEQFSADAVVVNFDPATFLGLLGGPGAAGRRRFPAYRRSHSISSLFLGVTDARLLAARFGRWNNWYHATPDLPEHLYDADPRDEPTGIYLNSPTLLKGIDRDAPPGAATVTAFAPCSYRTMKAAAAAGTAEALRERQTERLLDLIERRFIPGLRQNLAVTHLRTPLDNERLFHAPGGAIYGRALEPREAWKRLPYRGVLPNLYFVGATVSFPGIASVIQAACLVYQDLTRDKV